VARVADLPQPRVLVVVGREPGSGEVSSVWAAGPSTFYNDVIELAGGHNVCRRRIPAYPELSREGLIHLDPDVIVDLVPELDRRAVSATAARADWNGLGELRAVQAGRVHVLDHEFVEIPGPRIADTVVAMARLLHPELEAEPS
jgi:iron complex transport system substrate-binding protein